MARRNDPILFLDDLGDEVAIVRISVKRPGEKKSSTTVLLYLEAHEKLATTGQEGVSYRSAADLADLSELGRDALDESGWPDDCDWIRLYAYAVQDGRKVQISSCRATAPKERQQETGDMARAVESMANAQVRLLDKVTGIIGELGDVISAREDKLAQVLEQMIEARGNELEAHATALTNAVETALEQGGSNEMEEMGVLVLAALAERLGVVPPGMVEGMGLEEPEPAEIPSDPRAQA